MIRVTVHAWKNRNKVESALRDLKHNVDQCYTMFMVSSHCISNLTLTANSIFRDLDVRSHENRAATYSAYFLNHPKVDLDRMPGIGDTSYARKEDVSPDQKLPRATDFQFGCFGRKDDFFRWAHFHHNAEGSLKHHRRRYSGHVSSSSSQCINQTLGQLSSAELSRYEEPFVGYQRPFRPIIWDDFCTDNRKVLHQEVVKQTLNIQSILRTNLRSVLIHEGAWELSNLSIALYSLDMLEESAIICLWSVNLFRMLVKLNSKIYLPYLIHTLRLLAIFYLDNNLDAAFEVISEPVDLSRSLQTTTVGEELKVQFAGCLITSSVVFAAQDKHNQAIQDVHEAMEVLECIFIEKAIHEDVMETGFILRKFNWDQLLGIFPDVVIYEYAQALHILSRMVGTMGFVADAVKIEIRALQTFRIISPSYPNASIQAGIAEILARLAGQDFRSFVTLEEAYSYSKESETIYRRCFEHNSKKYGKLLCNVLWE